MFSLFLLVPVLLLILSSLGIAILRQVRPSIGYSWLWATLASLLAFGCILFLRWRLPLELSVGQWEPFDRSSLVLSFLVDRVSWPYAFSLVAILVAVVLTDSARLNKDTGPIPWIFCLLITGLGLLAILAGKPVTMVLAWTMIDLVELTGVFSTRAGRWLSGPMIITFAVRVSGTLLVLVAVLVASALGIKFTLNAIPSELALLMVGAAGLRLGVLPLNLPFVRDVYSWQGLGNLLRLIGPASCLVVLGRMPETAIPVEWQPLLLFLMAMASLYGSAMWLASDPTMSGRPYWVITLAGLAITCVIRGNPLASIAWGVALLLSGSVLFLYSAQNRLVLWLPMLATLGVIGLPFTPSASGWQGVIGPNFDLYNLVFAASVFLLCLGYVRRALVLRDQLYSMERWIHTVYPAGLLVLILSQWAIEALDWRRAFTPGVWPVSVAVGLLAFLVSLARFSNRASMAVERMRSSWLVAFSQTIGNGLAVFFRLNWLYRFLGWIYELLQGLIQLLTAIFEGDGGVMWAMVVLVLVISLLVGGGSP